MGALHCSVLRRFPFFLFIHYDAVGLPQGQLDQYVCILEEGTSPEVEEYFGKTAEYERIQALCGLASFYMNRGRNEFRDKSKKNEDLQKAAGFLNAARSVNVEEQLPHIGLGQLALAKACQSTNLDLKHFHSSLCNKSGGPFAALEKHPFVARILFLKLHQAKESLQVWARKCLHLPACDNAVVRSNVWAGVSVGHILPFLEHRYACAALFSQCKKWYMVGWHMRNGFKKISMS